MSPVSISIYGLEESNPNNLRYRIKEIHNVDYNLLSYKLAYLPQFSAGHTTQYGNVAGIQSSPTVINYNSIGDPEDVIYDKDNLKETLGELMADAGKKQIRIAETEKYAHVTFFFSGGREEIFKGEERIMIPSPKVETYDLKPEMSAFEVKDAVIKAIEQTLTEE